MNPYSRLIPRLNGKEIEERFGYYLGLVKKGVAGFIVFGGELRTLRAGLARLQAASDTPLIIASDLEQGLGQQVEGGTLFPPAMAVASAVRKLPRQKQPSMLKGLYTAFASEAAYAGINTILAPVLDINTNADNPIIAARAFGEDPDTVSFFGCEMIKTLQGNGIAACGKHFPGHGDTDTDSHISLPVVRKGLSVLEKMELAPFRKAVNEGVKMIMLGHLSVPALDPSQRPATISKEIISYLRSNLNFNGTIISDAMNMGGIGEYPEDEASLMALLSGVDIILHPTDPDRTASYLVEKNLRLEPLKPLILRKSAERNPPDFSLHKKLSDEISGMAVTIEGEKNLKIRNPFLLILDEDGKGKGEYLINALRRKYRDLQYRSCSPEEESPSSIPPEHDLVVCVFSETRAWKGNTATWLRSAIESLGARAKAFVSFGNPYVIRNLKSATKVYAFWNSESVQKAVAEKLAAM